IRPRLLLSLDPSTFADRRNSRERFFMKHTHQRLCPDGCRVNLLAKLLAYGVHRRLNLGAKLAGWRNTHRASPAEVAQSATPAGSRAREVRASPPSVSRALPIF